MGCEQAKIRSSVLDNSQLNNAERKSKFSNKRYQRRSSAVVPTASFDLSPLDKEAFSSTVCQQRQKAIDNMAYRKAIDQWRPTSIEQLIKFIQNLAPKGNQIDLAWIIFYWISQNINYDTEAFFNNRIGAQNSGTVFQSGKAVCEGYSSLYNELCSRTGLQCQKVSGYAKGLGFDIRQTKFDKTNHAWNIITLEQGHSYFVESTWGSGHLDGSSNQYKRKLNSHYFLCRPEHMIYEHLPEDDRKQLLAHRITVKQYLMLPLTYPEFFTLDLHLVSPACSSKVDLVAGEAYGLVLIRASNTKVKLFAGLKDKQGNTIEGGNSVHLDKRKQTLWQCRFAPPKPGKYNIFIYAKNSANQDQSALNAVVQFTFDVDRLPPPAISYPLTWPQFFDYNLKIIKPKNSGYIDWSSNESTSYYEILVCSPDKIHLSATMTDTSKRANVENGTLVNFNYQMKLWQCLFAPSATGVPFELTLFAKQADEKKSHCAVQFNLRPIPKDSLKQSMTFPLTYGTFSEHKCHLIEPLNGVLRSDSTVHFRCQIPGAQEVNITVDTNVINGKGLKPDENGVFDSKIQVGRKEVSVWVKFDGANKSYQGLLKYTVR